MCRCVRPGGKHRFCLSLSVTHIELILGRVVVVWDRLCRALQLHELFLVVYERIVHFVLRLMCVSLIVLQSLFDVLVFLLKVFQLGEKFRVLNLKLIVALVVHSEMFF